MKKVPHMKECPEAGRGNHTWLYHAACVLVEADFTDAEAAPILEGRMKRPPQPTEIADALRAARRTDKVVSQRWSARDFALTDEIGKNTIEWSPERPNAATQPTLRLLFPNNPLVCVGLSQSRFTTGRLSSFKNPEMAAFIVPSPMTSTMGKTQAGYYSQHALDNTGPRHYQVIEFDWGSIKKQLQIIRHLAENCEPAKLVMIVFSGKKSAHAWFDVRIVAEELQKNFFDYAVRCGADPRLWLRSQFVRMPGGRRDTGELQEILYLNEPYLRNRAIPVVNPST